MGLIVHPEVKKLKEKLSDLIYEYDNLNTHICPNIGYEYVSKFGIYEYEIYKLEFEINKLRRKIMLIRIQLNQENEVDISEIDEQLTEEVHEYEQKLKAQIDEIKFIENTEFEKLSEKDAKRLKEIYRTLIKKLHPDLNPKQSDYDIGLFMKANKAFTNGDLKELEALLVILPDDDENETNEISELEALVKDFEDKIREIKEDYPYNKMKFLTDKSVSDEYMEILTELIADRKETVADLKRKINNMI